MKDLVLVISSDNDVINVSRTLTSDYKLIWAKTGKEGIEAYQHNLMMVQVVVLDADLEDMLAQEWIQHVSRIGSLPYIILTASQGVSKWTIESMKAGAMDTVQKNPLKSVDLAIAVHQGFDLKTMSLHLSRSMSLSKHLHIRARLRAFLDFYKRSKSIGRAVAPHEMAMYFPSKSLELDFPLEGVIEAIHQGDTLPLLKQWKERPILLIVEEDSSLRLAFKNNFADDFEVIWAQNLEQAFSEIDQISELDCAILDIELSGMSGEKGVPILKKMFPKIQMVMISTGVDYPLISKALRQGAADYFLKPVNHYTLRKRLYSLLESSLLNRLLGQYMGADG